MSTRTFMLAAALVSLSASVAGCVSTTPHWDVTFGDSVRAANASQVIDPAAVRNTNPVGGIDGEAAQASHARYVRGFQAPVVPERTMISGSGK